jgi:transcriptional regulator with XRE-family HTH domain
MKTTGLGPDDRCTELSRMGERIQEQRRRRGLTQADVASRLNVSVAYVSLIERGDRNPPFTTMTAIARALDVKASFLVSDE